MPSDEVPVTAQHSPECIYSGQAELCDGSCMSPSEDGKTLVTRSGDELFRVAVVVFTNIRGQDYIDAAHAVTRAVSRACREHDGGLVFEQENAETRWEVPVEVRDVVELSMAMGNGYVSAVPTVRPYRMYGQPAGVLPGGIVRGYHPEEDDDIQ